MKTANQFFYHDMAIRDDLLTRVDLVPVCVGYADNPSDWRFTFQSHPFIRLYYLTEGCFQLAYADKTVDILPNRLYLVPGAFPFRYVYQGRNCHYWIHFSSAFLEHLPTLRHPLFIGEGDFPEMLALIKAMFALDAADLSVKNRMEERILLQRLLVPFLGIMEQENDHYLPPGIDKFSVVVDYILGHISENILSDDLARMIHMRRADFSAQFKKTFGIPPKQFICSQKIETAKRLLLRTEKDTTEVAACVGYPDERFFYRLFKKYTGTTPTAYRNANGYV